MNNDTLVGVIWKAINEGFLRHDPVAEYYMTFLIKLLIEVQVKYLQIVFESDTEECLQDTLIRFGIDSAIWPKEDVC